MTIVNSCKHVWHDAPVAHVIEVEGATLIYKLRLCRECWNKQLVDVVSPV